MTFIRISLGIIAASLFATAALAADNYDDGPACSKLLAANAKLSADAHRRCIIAISTTYVDAEENSTPPEKQLLADNVSRHRLGTPPNFAPGNGPKMIADMGHGVISAIKNRHWMVDGNEAWIVYDGYLSANPDKIGFYVAERFTIENGLIKEILIAGVNRL